jgi:RNA-splicing ligase RtcB
MEKLKIYARTVEDEAVAQINRMNESEAYKNSLVRIMPDCHAGAGCTIGTVIAIKDRVVPNTVGVDIGCGMFVVPLYNKDIDLALLDRVIREQVPSGCNIHTETNYGMCMMNYEAFNCRDVIDEEKASYSIGSLGGGNHFIEVDVDEYGNKYLVIHSGSRNLGVRVCKYYQDLAIKNCKKNAYDERAIVERLKAEGREKEISAAIAAAKAERKTIDPQLAYLEGADLQNYLHDMKLCQQYAASNRITIASIIGKFMPGSGIYHSIFGENSSAFHTVHNYIDVKHNILRKGAVSALNGEMLIIPINMRDGSLLCRGKGNIDWLYSAPHGAGRLMSRKKAKETLGLDEFKQSMNGIYTTSVCEDTIDEAPMAYKPMDEIIECIKDTVDVVRVIKPIYNFKAKE